MAYQFFLPMVLRWRASRAEAPLKIIDKQTPKIQILQNFWRFRHVFDRFPKFITMKERKKDWSRYQACVKTQ